MKKFLALFLILVLVFSMSACSAGVTYESYYEVDGSMVSDIDSENNGTTSDKTNTNNNTNTNNTNTNNTSGGKDTNTANCKHSYDPATCDKDSVCKLCGTVVKKALGHKFTMGNNKCQRTGCGATDPDWINWYTDGDIKITKAEVQQVMSMNFEKPKNVIVMIGDGMGPNDLIVTEKNGKGLFDFGLVMNQFKYKGLATTHCAGGGVTDSAAAGTALATGTKTTKGYIGISSDGKVLKNISEIARENGKKVGIVTNDTIWGATPAAYAVHNISRGNDEELIQAMLDFKPDVLIGSGEETLKKYNVSKYLYGATLNEFSAKLNEDPKCTKSFLGTIADKGIDSMSNTLAYCTEIALNRLSKSTNGFFLMVENTSTDLAGHRQDIKGKFNAVVTFDRAVANALKFVKNNPDTLLIVTADHETGGLQIPDGNYSLSDSLLLSNNHTGANVNVFAVGYGAEYFHNKTVDNTDIANFTINAVLGK